MTLPDPAVSVHSTMTDSSTQAVLPTTSPSSIQKSTTKTQSLYTHLRQPLSPNHTDIPMILCCFISGLVDSTIYNAFGTFVSMQTGNTIFIGLGAATASTTTKPYGWARSLVSIAFFCAGCFFFSRIRILHSAVSSSTISRATLMSSFAIQALITTLAAALSTADVIDGRVHPRLGVDGRAEVNFTSIVPIALLSFQSAGQIVTSRALGLAEVPSVVLTSMLHDIFSDRHLMTPSLKGKEVVKRNRRVVAFTAILMGAISGGYVSERTGVVWVSLWIAVAIKVGIVGAWGFWPAVEADDDGANHTA